MRFVNLAMAICGWTVIQHTTPTSTLQDLLRHRDTVLRAARAANSDISNLVSQQKWKWIRIHNISLAR